MAGYGQGLCLPLPSKLPLVVLFVVLRSSSLFISADDQSGLRVKCHDEDASFWHPLWKPSFIEGTKCDIWCPLNCSRSLGNYAEVIVNCLRRNTSTTHVSYPSNVTKLSWAHNEIRNIGKDSFLDLVDTLKRLHLNDNSLQHLQPGVFERLIKLQFLDLRHNKLEELMCGVFRGLENLEGIDVGNNGLKKIEPCLLIGVEKLSSLYFSNNMLKEICPPVFENLENLSILDLSNNTLKQIWPGVFNGLGNLHQLDLQSNTLKELESGVFKGLENMKSLRLDSNMLGVLQPGVFTGLRMLIWLYLNNNMLTQLMPTALAELTNLVVLKLSDNPLASLHPDTFQNLTSLDYLALRNITLTFLPDYIFQALVTLQHLDLSANMLMELTVRSFEGCVVLKTLNLTRNPLYWISKDSFIELNVSVQVFVDNHASCCFITKAKCISNSSKPPFLTCRRLLPYDVLRVGIWVVSTLAIVNNVLGILLKCKQKQHINKVQFLLITNLSISDLLMGVYLIILLSADLYYTDYFPSHSETWRNSMHSV